MFELTVPNLYVNLYIPPYVITMSQVSLSETLMQEYASTAKNNKYVENSIPNLLSTQHGTD